MRRFAQLNLAIQSAPEYRANIVHRLIRHSLHLCQRLQVVHEMKLCDRLTQLKGRESLWPRHHHSRRGENVNRHLPDGPQITFAGTGSGPPLMLAHGSASDHTYWTCQGSVLRWWTTARSTHSAGVVAVRAATPTSTAWRPPSNSIKTGSQPSK